MEMYSLKIWSKSRVDEKTGDAVIVPAGAKHNVVNTSKKSELKLYTIY